MAARLWRWLLGCELAIAAAVAASLAVAWQLSAAEALGVGFGTYVVTLFVLVTSSFILAHSAAHDLRASSVGYTLRALCTESFHLGLAQLLMCADPYFSCRDVPAPADRRSARPVLLIHGFVCNRAVWRTLIQALRGAGFAPVRAINLEPPFADIDTHVVRVERELLAMQRQCEGARVTIIAHSTGGLVARAALRSAGPGVIGQIVTVATAHHGTANACRFRSRPTQQMCPGSSWLRWLNGPQDAAASVPLTSIYSLEDGLIAPARSAVVAGAQSQQLRGLGHFELLRAAKSIDCVLAALQGGCQA